jgi:hypothetical protein
MKLRETKMLHEPASECGPDHASEFKSKLGLKLFFFYAIIYVGFVGIGIYKIEAYKEILFWGLNVAVVYGFGLIALALIMALIYNAVCTKEEEKMDKLHGTKS